MDTKKTGIVVTVGFFANRTVPVARSGQQMNSSSCMELDGCGILVLKRSQEVESIVKIPRKMEYPLHEQVGPHELFVGRMKEFSWFLGGWYDQLLDETARCQAILARRKKGKSVFLQRLYNILWTRNDPRVIPFFFTMPEVQTTQADFSKSFLGKLISQLVAYEQRDHSLVSSPVPFQEIPTITNDPLYLKYYRALTQYEQTSNWNLMWESASSAPSEIANLRDLRIVQIMDEFQYINEYILNQKSEKISTMSGSYLTLSEQRRAPLIVSGSEVHWLMRIVNSLVGRFKTRNLGNLPEEEAKEAILRYATHTKTRINDQTIEQIWNLTEGDPLYIREIFFSEHNTTRDYTDPQKAVEVYEKEMMPGGMIYNTWMEYMVKIFGDVNQKHAKRIVLYLFQKERECTRQEIMRDLKLDASEQEVENKLQSLVKADLIGRGETSVDYRISPDQTYEWVFRREYQKEIVGFVPDIQSEVRRKMGIDNNEIGLFAEYTLRRRLLKGFNLNEITQNGPDQQIRPRTIQERVPKKLGNERFEIDLIVESDPEIWIEVKRMKAKFGKRQLTRIRRLKEAIDKMDHPPILVVHASGGFTVQAARELNQKGILYGNT